MDKLSPEARSENMRKVPSRNTGPEIVVRKLLHKHGYRFRIHSTNLPGSPDVVLPRYRVAVFVHGCFWHGHQACARATLPSTRTEFWSVKIERNRGRDHKVCGLLEEHGFRVVTIWQCELRNDEEILRRVDEATGKTSV